jgi:hypothetical protein
VRAVHFTNWEEMLDVGRLPPDTARQSTVIMLSAHCNFQRFLVKVNPIFSIQDQLAPGFIWLRRAIGFILQGIRAHQVTARLFRQLLQLQALGVLPKIQIDPAAFLHRFDVDQNINNR